MVILPFELSKRMRTQFQFGCIFHFYSVWQHVDCMGVDKNNIPENYMCELCDPRRVDKQRAVQIQTRKRRELAHLR